MLLELREGGDDVAPPAIDEEIAAGDEALEVHPGDLVEAGVVAGALQLGAGEVDGALDVVDVTILEERIAEHRAERRRERGGELEGDAFVRHAPEDLKEGQVGFRDGLEEPIFLKEFVILRMAHIREVRMKHER